MCIRDSTAGERDAETGRSTCVVNQVVVPLGGPPPSGQEGFFYDTRPDPTAPDCRQHIEFTSNAGLVSGATAVIECVQAGGTSSTSSS